MPITTPWEHTTSSKTNRPDCKPITTRWHKWWPHRHEPLTFPDPINNRREIAISILTNSLRYWQPRLHTPPHPLKRTEHHQICEAQVHGHTKTPVARHPNAVKPNRIHSRVINSGRPHEPRLHLPPRLHLAVKQTGYSQEKKPAGVPAKQRGDEEGRGDGSKKRSWLFLKLCTSNEPFSAT